MNNKPMNKLCPTTKLVPDSKGKVRKVGILFDDEGRQILRPRGRRL